MGTEQRALLDRSTLGFALERRAAQIPHAVLGEWHRRSPAVAASADARVHDDILRTTEMSTLAVAHYLTDGESQTEAQARALATTGKAPLRDTITLAEVTKLYLYWRDTTIAVLTEEADAAGIDADVLREAIAIVRRASDGSIVRMTREFEAEHDRLQRELAVEQTRLSHHAFHDALTGLPNRRLFFDRLSHALELARRSDVHLGLLFVDVDRFKSINDELGHLAGDRVLTVIAERLMAVVRECDTVARLGGDEFVVLCEQLGDPQGEQIDLARRIGEALAAPIDCDLASVSVSIGIAVAAADGDADALLSQADHAMYVAKRRGPGGFHIWAAA
ncbi:MAG TPA: GGDEF domain-containing protein [Acidimicrobiia bacterium]